MERLELARLLGADAAVVNEPAALARVIEESKPRPFMDAFAAAVASGGPVFLADPAWGTAERARLNEFLQQSLPLNSRGWLMSPSGGTSGALKFARHDEDTIAAAVRGFSAHFGLARVNALGVLPLHHVSGLMAWMRCALTGGKFVPGDWKRLEAGETPALDRGDWVISLVPTQLQRLLLQPRAIEWLREFRAIFIGGGPAWPELLDAAAHARLPISLSYGMTETAAMVTALRPAEFLAGARSSGPALPHARVSITDEGVVRIEGESVCRGYFPEFADSREFTTEDLGRLDERGHLHVLGRRDAVIITGGKKVQPLDVENALRASGEFDDVAVIGVPDREWGEVVVACYAAANARSPDLARAVMLLAPHQRPKRFVAMSDWLRNAQGKLNRAELRARVMAGAG